MRLASLRRRGRDGGHAQICIRRRRHSKPSGPAARNSWMVRLRGP
jgi:hypothetical protein